MDYNRIFVRLLSLSALLTVLLGKQATAQSFPVFVETDVGQGQGVVIWNNHEHKPSAASGSGRYMMLYTAKHLMDGSPIRTTTVVGDRNRFDNLGRIEGYDIAFSSKRYRARGFSAAENNTWVQRVVPSKELLEKVGDTVYGERVSSRAGGFDQIPLKIISIDEGHLYLEPMSRDDFIVQSDSGMAIWSGKRKMDQFGNFPMSDKGPKLIGILSGYEGDKLKVMGAGAITDAILEQFHGMPTGFLAEPNVSVDRVVRGSPSWRTYSGQTPTYTQLSGSNSRSGDRFHNNIDSSQALVFFDLGDEDRVVRGFSFMQHSDFTILGREAYTNQFRPPDGGTWTKVSFGCSKTPVGEWLRYDCEIQRPAIIRGLGVFFDADLSAIAAFKITP